MDLDLSNRYPIKTAKAIWHRIGSPEKMKEINCIIKKLLGGEKSVEDFIHRSDVIVAADKEGNICSMIHTINSQMWGTGPFVQGVALPHSAVIFKAFVN